MKRKIIFNPEKKEVLFTSGKFGTQSYSYVAFTRIGDNLTIEQEDYGGGSSFELPFTEVAKALEQLKPPDVRSAT